MPQIIRPTGPNIELPQTPKPQILVPPDVMRMMQEIADGLQPGYKRKFESSATAFEAQKKAQAKRRRRALSNLERKAHLL